MPQALAYIAQWAASYAAAAWGSAAYYAVYAVVYAAEVYALTRATQSLTKKGSDGSSRGLEVQVTDTGQQGFAIYGRVRASGVNVIPPISGGDDGRYLEQILALAVHELTSYQTVHVDGGGIANGQITSVTGTADDGKVTSPPYNNAMWIRRYLGTSTQTVDYILNQRYPTIFDSNFRGRGIAYVALTYDWGKGETYRSVPQIAFEVQGKKCYDPRLDVSPGANPTNATYIAFTSNPALCWADYLMADFGGSVSSANIDWTSVVEAANICDQLVDTPDGSEFRYTFNGRIVLADEPDWRNNARLFIDAMLGRMVRRGDKWYCYAGAWTDPSYSINKRDWLSIDRIKTVQPRDGGRWNRCFTWYVDPDRNWQRLPCYTRTNPIYKSADGNEDIPLEIEQPACTSEWEAQRKAEIILRQSRNQIAITGRLGSRFRKLVVGDTVALTFEDFGWSDKIMRVRTCNLNPDATIDVGLVEEQEVDWEDLLDSDYNSPTFEDPPAVNPSRPSAPTSLTITSNVNGTLNFSIGEPAVVPQGTRYQIMRSVSSLLSTTSPVYDGESLNVELVCPNSLHYYFSVAYARGINSADPSENKVFSPYYPNTFGVLGVPADLVFTASVDSLPFSTIA